MNTTHTYRSELDNDVPYTVEHSLYKSLTSIIKAYVFALLCCSYCFFLLVLCKMY